VAIHGNCSAEEMIVVARRNMIITLINNELTVDECLMIRVDFVVSLRWFFSV